jgi:hypothetical protein
MCAINLHEIQRLRIALTGIHRRIRMGRKEWIPALGVVQRELDKLMGRRESPAPEQRVRRLS